MPEGREANLMSTAQTCFISTRAISGTLTRPEHWAEIAAFTRGVCAAFRWHVNWSASAWTTALWQCWSQACDKRWREATIWLLIKTAALKMLPAAGQWVKRQLQQCGYWLASLRVCIHACYTKIHTKILKLTKQLSQPKHTQVVFTRLRQTKT